MASDIIFLNFFYHHIIIIKNKLLLNEQDSYECLEPFKHTKHFKILVDKKNILST